MIISLKLLAVLLFTVLVLGFAGTADYENEQLEFQSYCDRVKDKVHTDYKNAC